MLPVTLIPAAGVCSVIEAVVREPEKVATMVERGLTDNRFVIITLDAKMLA